VAPLPARQFLQDSCPGRLPRLRHLPSQTTRHPVHGRPHRLSTFGGRWELAPRDTWRPWSCPAPGGGRWRRGDMWRPWSCPASGGGRWSRPRSCPEPGEDAGATGTHGAPGPAPSSEVGARATGTHGAPGAALRREVGAGAAGTRGAPRSCPAPGGGCQSHGAT
jgi:hypothetical protein